MRPIKFFQVFFRFMVQRSCVTITRRIDPPREIPITFTKTLLNVDGGMRVENMDPSQYICKLLSTQTQSMKNLCLVLSVYMEGKTCEKTTYKISVEMDVKLKKKKILWRTLKFRGNDCVVSWNWNGQSYSSRQHVDSCMAPKLHQQR